MIFTALRLLATGTLTAEQLQQLLDALDLQQRARTEGPALDISIAHRSYLDQTGRRLWVDLSRLSADGWVMAVFYDGRPPDDEVVQGYRRLFRGLVDRLGLDLLEVVPAMTADEVYVPAPPPPTPEDSQPWQWPWQHQTLDDLWRFLQVRRTAPREVKVATLRGWIAVTPLWAHAPQALRSEVEAFLGGD